MVAQAIRTRPRHVRAVMTDATIATAASEVIALSATDASDMPDPLSQPMRANAMAHATKQTLQAIICFALSPVTRAPRSCRPCRTHGDAIVANFYPPEREVRGLVC